MIKFQRCPLWQRKGERLRLKWLWGSQNFIYSSPRSCFFFNFLCLAFMFTTLNQLSWQINKVAARQEQCSICGDWGKSPFKSCFCQFEAKRNHNNEWSRIWTEAIIGENPWAARGQLGRRGMDFDRRWDGKVSFFVEYQHCCDFEDVKNFHLLWNHIST